MLTSQVKLDAKPQVLFSKVNKVVCVMTPSIGLNLRVTGHCNQGGRKYMEDAFVVAYQQSEDQKDLEYAYFGIFDGHGGREAALFAKEHLMNNIVSQKSFWSDDDNQVLKAIRDGFLATHRAMWREVGNWPKTVSGLPSTSGTTSSIAFIRRRKLYIGHVGDSKIVLGFQLPGSSDWCAYALTKDHKPETPEEKQRIKSVGGLVMNKAGVERVVWNRPRPGHKGPIRRSTPFDQIPFLAVARSLGDLWSYNYLRHEFVVSPDPDVDVININPRMHRCVIFASDGLWNMLTTQCAVKIVQTAEEENEKLILEGGKANGMGKQPNNPSKLLVDAALKHWFELGMRADNTSVVTVMLDPPGPPKSEVLLRQRVMKRLRPRDEQGDEDSNSSSGNTFDASCTLNSKDKKKTGDCLELQPSRERKRSSDSFTEVVSKERKLSSDTDETVPKNLPKPVILSPQRVVIKHKIPSTPQSPVIASCVPSIEKKQTFTKLSSADINLLPCGITDVKSNKKGHDPPKEEQNKETETTNENINDPPGTIFENINDSAERECGETSEPKNTLNENYQGKQNTFPNKALDRTDSVLPKIGKESSLSSPDTGCKENGRIHLCEVDNFFKLNNRTLDCVETANDVKQNVLPNDSKPVPSKMKNLRKRSLRRNHSVYQKPDASLKHTGLQGKKFSSVHSGLHEKSNPSRTARKTRSRLTHCHKTRAQVELRKIKL